MWPQDLCLVSHLILILMVTVVFYFYFSGEITKSSKAQSKVDLPIDDVQNGDANILVAGCILDKLKAGLNGQTKLLLDNMASPTTCTPTENKGDKHAEPVTNGPVSNGDSLRKRPADSEIVDSDDSNPAKVARMQIEEITRKNDDLVKTITDRESPVTTSDDSTPPKESDEVAESTNHPDSNCQKDEESEHSSEKSPTEGVKSEVSVKSETQSKGLLSIGDKMRDYTKNLIKAVWNKNITNSDPNSPINSQSVLPSTEDGARNPDIPNKVLDKGNLFDNLATTLAQQIGTGNKCEDNNSRTGNKCEDNNSGTGNKCEDNNSDTGNKCEEDNSTRSQANDQPAEADTVKSSDESNSVENNSTEPIEQLEDLQSGEKTESQESGKYQSDIQETEDRSESIAEDKTLQNGKFT